MRKDSKLMHALLPLLKNNLFKLDNLVKSNKNFGNISIVLVSADNISVKFIKDKGIFWCSIAYNDSYFFIEDIYKYLKLDITFSSVDFIEYIYSVSTSIIENYISLKNLFFNKQSDFKQTLKDIAINRIIKKQLFD